MAATVSLGAAHGQEDAIGVVEGRVLGPLGEPMRGVEVTAAIWPALDDVIGRTRTDGDGMFVLGRLPLRTVTLLATAPGHTVGWATASLSAERTADGVQFRVWDAITLRGVVVDADDRPVADAAVLGSKDYIWFDSHFRSPEARSDAEGRFTLRGVPIGDCVVRAWAPGSVLREHPLFATAETEVKVRRAGGVRHRSIGRRRWRAGAVPVDRAAGAQGAGQVTRVDGDGARHQPPRWDGRLPRRARDRRRCTHPSRGQGRRGPHRALPAAARHASNGTKPARASPMSSRSRRGQR